MKRIHSSVDVQGLLSWDNRDLRRMVGAFQFDGQRATSVQDLRSRLLALLTVGTRFLPMGEPCEGWTPERGCPGHERPTTPTEETP